MRAYMMGGESRRIRPNAADAHAPRIRMQVFVYECVRVCIYNAKDEEEAACG